MSARTHTHVSNRAKDREALDRKTIFKSVFDNPFRAEWPSVPTNIQNSILAQFLNCLEGISEYHNSRERGKGKRKRKRVQREECKNAEPDQMDTGTQVITTLNDDILWTAAGTAAPIVALHSPDIVIMGRPAILDHLTVGINQVTKLLESQIKSCPTVIVSEGIDIVQAQSAIRAILVCRDDVDPTIIISHLPHLVAAYNANLRAPVTSGQRLPPIKLVPLPKGAEASLAEALGIRRVAVVAIDHLAPVSFDFLLDSVPVLSATWSLSRNGRDREKKSLIPTHIKQVRTSAPKDIKAAKEQRAKGRTVAKGRRQKNIQ